MMPYDSDEERDRKMYGERPESAEMAKTGLPGPKTSVPSSKGKASTDWGAKIPGPKTSVPSCH